MAKVDGIIYYSSLKNPHHPNPKLNGSTQGLVLRKFTNAQFSMLRLKLSSKPKLNSCEKLNSSAVSRGASSFLCRSRRQTAETEEECLTHNQDCLDNFRYGFKSNHIYFDF